MAEMSTWEAMRTRIHAQLERQTGAGVAEWNQRIAAAGLADEAALRRWLSDQDVTGYPQMLLVCEAFGYPDFLLATADELVDGQYEDRPRLRPILDAVVAAVSGFDGVTIQARKTYVSLVSPRRTFAVVKATTRDRVDLGLRLPGVQPAEPVLAARSLGNDNINLRIPLSCVDNLDEAALAWLRRAYEENS
jgi:hypothetical protein